MTTATISLDELLTLPPQEMLKYDETPSIEYLRDKPQVYFDDVSVGMELPRYIKQYDIVQFQRWSITMENTHQVHYDLPYSVNYDKLPGVLFHGSWRMNILAVWLKNWVLPDGWSWKANFQVREMVVNNEITIVWGKVTNKEIKDGLGIVDIDFGIKNQDGVEGCPGKATVALPLKGGRPVPYPFVPPRD